MVDGEIDVQQLEKRIRGRVKSQMEKSQREYYLNEQMKAIQKELGELDEAPNELEDLARKVAAAGMPKPVETKAKNELNKLKQMSPMSAEAAVVRNYLDWLLGVPWKKRSKSARTSRLAQDVLDADHYGLEKVKERILEYLAVQTRVKQMKGAILCLVGPPGVGKTSLGQSIAKATNRKFVRMSLGGVRDEAEIRGHRRTYVGSMPGRIVQNLNKTGSKNPLFVLDEIDKMSDGFPRRSVLGAAGGARPGAEPRLQRPLSGSGPGPVRSDVRGHGQLAQHSRPAAGPHGSDPHPRLHRGRKAQHRRTVPDPQAAESQRSEAGGAEDFRGRVRDIVRYYTRESGVRNLEREIAKICRKVVKEIALAGPQPAKKKGKPPRSWSLRRIWRSIWACAASISAVPKSRTRSVWSPVWPGPKSAAICCRSKSPWCPARAS